MTHAQDCPYFTSGRQCTCGADVRDMHRLALGGSSAVSGDASERIAEQMNANRRAYEASHASQASLAKRGTEPSEKQRKLLELADRIDHEQLWRWAGMDHHKMTPEQKDRMNAGVNLRRYARLWKLDRWVVFPPVGPVSFSALTLDEAVEMAKRDEARKSQKEAP